MDKKACKERIFNIMKAIKDGALKHLPLRDGKKLISELVDCLLIAETNDPSSLGIIMASDNGKRLSLNAMVDDIGYDKVVDFLYDVLSDENALVNLLQITPNDVKNAMNNVKDGTANEKDKLIAKLVEENAISDDDTDISNAYKNTGEISSLLIETLLEVMYAYNSDECNKDSKMSMHDILFAVTIICVENSILSNGALANLKTSDDNDISTKKLALNSFDMISSEIIEAYNNHMKEQDGDYEQNDEIMAYSMIYGAFKLLINGSNRKATTMTSKSIRKIFESLKMEVPDISGYEGMTEEDDDDEEELELSSFDFDIFDNVSIKSKEEHDKEKTSKKDKKPKKQNNRDMLRD